MFHINDVKNGITFSLEGNLYQVLEFQHVKPGKGPAFIRMKIKNLRTGSTIEKTFNTNIKLEKAIVDKQKAQYLYENNSKYNFMNMQTYETIELAKEQIGEDVNYLKENLEVELTFYNGELLGIILPDKIEVEVKSTEPGVRGNTATNATKEAVVETGLIVKVPLFIEEGEKIMISTKDGKYDSRAWYSWFFFFKTV